MQIQTIKINLVIITNNIHFKIVTITQMIIFHSKYPCPYHLVIQYEGVQGDGPDRRGPHVDPQGLQEI